MMMRTDLAIESSESFGEVEGAAVERSRHGEINTVRVEVKTDGAAEKLGKPKGTYITVDVGDIANGLSETDGMAGILAEELSDMMGDFKSALVIGVGNTDITPDALGPKVADGILATRHIKDDFAKSIGLSGLRSVSVLSPGVLGKTGMEAAEIIRSVTDTVKPDVVIAVDALAAADAERLGSTVQINDSGISPGSGVGNRRKEISRRTLGTRVIAVGVPTVADSSCFGRGGYIVTPREIDLLISRAAELLSHAINFALQPEIDREIILSLV